MNRKSVFKLLLMCSLIAGLAVFTNTLAGAATLTQDQLVSNVEGVVEPFRQVKAEVSENGEVTLTGIVQTEGERQDAEKRVKSLNGVTKVENKIEIGPSEGESVGDYVDDATTTTSVKTKLLAEDGLKSVEIHVDTVEGVVTLTGTVDDEAQKSLAEQVARSVGGVSSVVNKLTLK